MKLTFASVRNAILLLGGLLLLGHETLVVPEPRIYLLIISTGMLGIPAALGADQLFVRGSGGDSPNSSDRE